MLKRVMLIKALTRIRHAHWRRWHRWLAWGTGLQLLIWCVSGAYMVFFDLGFIRGNHLIRTDYPPLPVQHVQTISKVLQLYPQSSDIYLKNLWLSERPQPVYFLQLPERNILLDALTLQPLILQQEQISAIARHTYLPSDTPCIRNIRLITDNPPTELNAALLPVWRVDFDDFANTAFYFSPVSGELLSRRHDFWRGFDVMWMLHIMDYAERSDVQNNLLRTLIIGSLLFTLTGVVLLLLSFRWLPAGRR